jgi:hypothetical protein
MRRHSFRTATAVAVLAVIVAAIVPLTAACGPEAPEKKTDPPGVLEYETPVAQYFREDRRVEVVALDPILSPDGCGYLTDRAYYDLVTTIDSLDPSADYLWSDCLPDADPKGLVRIDGFEHSPFVCDWNCCHVDLGRIALVYFVVGNNLVGLEPVIDDVPYVALDPDRPCE